MSSGWNRNPVDVLDEGGREEKALKIVIIANREQMLMLFGLSCDAELFGEGRKDHYDTGDENEMEERGI